jgi:hypothetical protein
LYSWGDWARQAGYGMKRSREEDEMRRISINWRIRYLGSITTHQGNIVTIA